jgi:N-terminal domain of Peptidase_S41 in eukaryotic IRBP/Peptidase family S41
MDQTDPLLAIQSLADLVRVHYLFAERADHVASQVEQLAGGQIATLSSAEQLAAELTDMLRDVTGDLHFKVTSRVLTPEELAVAPEDRWKYSMPGVASNFGFRSARVNEGTALLTLTSLDYIKWSGPTARAAMNFVRHAERVLIDVRDCQGGDPELIEHLAGYFLGGGPVELASVHWRDGRIEVFHSDPHGAEFQFDPDVALVVIVGPETASGGEALADALQATG